MRSNTTERKYISFKDTKYNKQLVDRSLIANTMIGNIQEIQKLLQIGANVHAIDTQGKTALIWAANQGYDEILNLLLNQDQSKEILEHMDYNINNALHNAVINGHTSIVISLLNRGADICTKNGDEKNAFDLALEYHPYNTELTNIILQHVATIPLEDQYKCINNINQLNTYKNFRYKNIMDYFYHEHVNKFNEFINLVLTDSENILGITKEHEVFQSGALVTASNLGDLASLRNLLANGMDINTCDHQGDTALHVAVRCGNMKIVEFLVQEGANINVRNHNGYSPLDSCTLYGDEAHYQIFGHLASQENINATDRNFKGHNAINYAARYFTRQYDYCIMPIFKKVIELYPDPKEGAIHHPDVYRNLFHFGYGDPEYLTNLISLYFTKSSMEPHIKEIINEFDEHLKKQYAWLSSIKLNGSNPEYSQAIDATNELIYQCNLAKLSLLKNPNNLLSFQRTCKDAIDNAQPVLSQHRGINKILANFLNFIANLPIPLLSSAMRFFSLKTNSEKRLDALDKTLSAVTIDPEKLEESSKESSENSVNEETKDAEKNTSNFSVR